MWVNLDDFVSMSDYAKLANKTTAWVTILVKRGKLPFIKHGKRVLIPINGDMPDYISNQSLIVQHLNQDKDETL